MVSTCFPVAARLFYTQPASVPGARKHATRERGVAAKRVYGRGSAGASAGDGDGVCGNEGGARLKVGLVGAGVGGNTG